MKKHEEDWLDTDASVMEAALTDAIDWVNQPHRAPLLDELCRDCPQDVIKVMEFWARVADDAGMLWISRAWEIEAEVRRAALPPPKMTVEQIEECLARVFCVCKPPLPRVEWTSPYFGQCGGIRTWLCSGCGRPRRRSEA